MPVLRNQRENSENTELSSTGGLQLQCSVSGGRYECHLSAGSLGTSYKFLFFRLEELHYGGVLELLRMKLHCL